jgi:putative ABC transport system substrate-binding protein
MLRIQRRYWVLAAGWVLAGLSSAGAQAAEPVKSVAVTTIVEHPALDAVRDGVKEALAKAGYVAGQNLRWQYQTAQGNVGTAAQIARKFVGDQPDVIVAISTPSAQALLAATKRIPIVFSAVTDPVAGQLTPSWAASGSNMTGVSNALDLQRQIDLIRRIRPQARRLGVVYNPGEANSASVIQQLRQLLPQQGMTLVEAAAPRSVDVAAAARSLLGKVDLFYTNNDNAVMSAYEAIAKVANDARVPLLSADTDSVKRGALAAYGIDYHELGLQTGAMVVRILKGEAAGAIEPERGARLRLVVNLDAAARQGVQLPPDLLASAQSVLR